MTFSVRWFVPLRAYFYFSIIYCVSNADVIKGLDVSGETSKAYILPTTWPRGPSNISPRLLVQKGNLWSPEQKRQPEHSRCLRNKDRYRKREDRDAGWKVQVCAGRTILARSCTFQPPSASSSHFRYKSEKDGREETGPPSLNFSLFSLSFSCPSSPFSWGPYWIFPLLAKQ